jgi:nucleoside-diphosphate-sugar epimerase
MRSNKFIVTGSSGFIGENVYKRLKIIDGKEVLGVTSTDIHYPSNSNSIKLIPLNELSLAS